MADLPVDALIARAEALASHWASALVLARPLDSVGRLRLEQIARQAPSLCAQTLAALRGDGELQRLLGALAGEGRQDSGSAWCVAEIVGADDGEAIVRAVEELRGVLWEGLLEEIGQCSARQVADAADRLAYVCALLASVAVADANTGEARSSSAGRAAPATREAVTESASGFTQDASRSTEGAAGSLAQGPVTIVDERARPREVERAATVAGEEAGAVDAAVAAWPAVSREQVSPEQVSPPPTRGVREEIAIRDERGGEGPAAWIGSIGRQLERFKQDRLPFAVLLVELGGAGERLHEQPRGPVEYIERVERELAGALEAAAGSFTRERDGRYWLLAPGTDRQGARALAERLVTAVESCSVDRARPLDVAIGVAVSPEDGREAAALAAHADVSLYADRSAVRASASRRVMPLD